MHPSESEIGRARRHERDEGDQNRDIITASNCSQVKYGMNPEFASRLLGRDGNREDTRERWTEQRRRHNWSVTLLVSIEASHCNESKLTLSHDVMSA